jgi:hypothetical protein
MNKRYHLSLSLRTRQGFEVCGEYTLSNDREAAKELFRSLLGSSAPSDSACLHIDLVETVNGLPEKVETKCCSLEQFCANSKLIIKEIFRLKTLEECI